MNKKTGSANEHLLKEFSSFVSAHRLFTKKDHLLLAVSGGIDSIALFHILRLKGYKFSVAHCNFKLRGKSSEKDEKFVRDLCESYRIPFYSKSFDTLNFSEDHGISIQMAARDLRYSWFNQLMKIHSLDYLCTAHHMNDSVESVLLNLSRETGIDGITGIKPVNGKLIRPLLFASKKQLTSFVKLHAFNFRKDKSNEEIKYKRNLVRKKIVPFFEKLNPSFISSFSRSIDHFNDAQVFIQEKLIEMEKLIVKENNGVFEIDIVQLRKSVTPSLFFHHFLNRKGIEHSYSEGIIALMDAQTGKHIITDEFMILKDRNYLVVSPVKKTRSDVVSVDDGQDFVSEPVNLEFQKKIVKSIPKLSSMEMAADYSLLKFPLEIRAWEKGDSFVPLGMKGKKKISDLLIDSKVPRNKKDDVFVLVNGDGKIIWVIGIRPDERFKIKQPETLALIVKFNGHN